jgi:hypothetical protein
MAKDALLQTLGVMNAGTAAMASATTYYSSPVSLEPFGQNGTHNNLFMRFMLAQPTYAALPAATTASNFQFGIDVTKDGATWSNIYASPTDQQAFKTHIVNTMSATAGQAPLTLLYPTVTSTATVTNGSANITAAPVCSIGDALYFGTAVAPFALATPYYVISMTPTQATAGSATSTATVQLSAAPGGVPIVPTAGGTPVLTKYLTNLINYTVGELVYWTGTAAAGTNAATAAVDTAVPPIITGGGNVQKFYVLSVTSSITGQVVTISNSLGGPAFLTTLGITAGASFLVQPCLAGGEYYVSLNTTSGYIDAYGAVQDTYKYVRGWIKPTFPAGVNPSALSRCDVTPGRDGAYS